MDFDTRYIALLLVLSASFIYVSGNQTKPIDLFRSTLEMQHLVVTLEKIVIEYNDYIKAQETVVQLMKRQLGVFQKYYEYSESHGNHFADNPINALTLILRLTQDFALTKEYVTTVKDLSDEFHRVTNESLLLYPNTSDVQGAIAGMMRIKQCYNLSIKEISEGKIDGDQYGIPMSVSDCNVIAKELNRTKDYANALEWMSIALHKYSDEDQSLYIVREEMLLFVGKMLIKLGELKRASDWTEEVKRQGMHRDRVLVLEREIQKARRLNYKGYKKPIDDLEQDFYRHCRQEFQIVSEVKSKLKCYYSSDNHPYLKIAPVKIEEVYLQPNIALFPGIISDEERNIILETAKSRTLKRSGVRINGTVSALVGYRVSKQLWIDYNRSEVAARISRRMQMVTGLDFTFAEPLQVANYGLGGHYLAHFDFAAKRGLNISDDLRKMRYATILFYLSDVAKGGATVFPNLGVYIKPMKNSAVFWVNLHPSCEGDYATLHGACPIMQGSKWVATIWINQKGQELIRPCGAKYQKEGFERTYEYSVK